MNEKEIEMMERYIFEVTRRLPANQREEVGMELKELIGEMYEREEQPMEAVLVKLGDPKEFARKYRDGNNYLISSEYYDNYIWILKIVLICVAASAVVSTVISVIVQDSFHILMPFESSGGLISSAIWAFGLVTLIFAAMERMKVKIEVKETSEWTTERLSPIPEKKGMISRGESLAGIIFLAIFAAIFLFTPHLFGAYVMEDEKIVQIIPIFNLNQWNLIRPFFLVSFLAGLMDEIVKLIVGCYCRMVMYISSLMGAIQLVMAVFVLKVIPIWNLDFLADVKKAFDVSFVARGDLLSYWGTAFFANAILAIVCICILAEVGSTIYKTLRYGAK